MRLRFYFFFALLLIVGGEAFASPHLITLAGGILRPDHPRDLIQLEYKGWIPKTSLRPQVGFFTSDFSTVYIYGGIALDLYLIKCFVVTPSFSPGIYFRGNGKNLGFPLEFRSALEFAFHFQNWTRLGVQIFHLSNAHLSHRNPGVNGSALFFSFPIRRPLV